MLVRLSSRTRLPPSLFGCNRWSSLDHKDDSTMAAAKAVSTLEFLGIGLDVFGYKRWRYYKEHANIKRFKEHYGISPLTCHQIWESLRNSIDDSIKLHPKAKPIHLLLAIVHLWSYPTEANLASQFGMASKNTCRKWRRLYVEKLASLFPSLVSRARLPKQLQQFSSLANPSLMLFLLYRLERWKRQMMA